MESNHARPGEHIGLLLSDISRLARKEFDRRVRGLRLTRAQWLFLYNLARQPGCTQSDMAEYLQVEKISVSRQADRMERAGWIRRTSHARDGRAYHLHLTARAGRVIGRLQHAADNLRSDYLRGIPAARQKAMQADLARIKRNLLQMDGDDRPKIT